MRWPIGEGGWAPVQDMSKSGLLHRCWIRLPGGLAGDGRSPTFISQNAHGGLKGSVPQWVKACSDIATATSQLRASARPALG